MQRKSNIASLLFILIPVLCAVAASQRKVYKFVRRLKTWENAQDFCRQQYIDLAFISNKEDAKRFADRVAAIAARDIGHVWIGLYRDIETPQVWKWSGEEVSEFSFWGEGPPNMGYNQSACMTVWARNHTYYDRQCTERHYFICYKHAFQIKLVKENKTWVEALLHCRDQHVDLPSLLSPEEDTDAQFLIQKAQTDHVWTGLRFLTGEWLWVNGKPLEHQAWSNGQLPHCPALHLHCGTVAREGEWGIRDCGERRNFLCSTKK